MYVGVLSREEMDIYNAGCSRTLCEMGGVVNPPFKAPPSGKIPSTPLTAVLVTYAAVTKVRWAKEWLQHINSCNAPPVPVELLLRGASLPLQRIYTLGCIELLSHLT
jgi:hypothetical protein